MLADPRVATHGLVSSARSPCLEDNECHGQVQTRHHYAERSLVNT